MDAKFPIQGSAGRTANSGIIWRDMRSCNHAIVLLIASLFSAISYAQVRPSQRPTRPAPPRSSQPPYMQKLKQFEENAVATKAVLKNGLTVIVQELRAYPVATVSTFVKSGYIHETPETYGMSELIARMFYRGTSTRAPDAMSREIKSMGGTVRRSVSLEQSNFELIVPSNQWKRALEIQADALLNPLVDPDQLKKGIDLTLNEVRLSLEEPERSARYRLLELAFGARGSGRGPLGNEEILRSLSQQKVLSYYKTRFTAPQILLLIVGDVNAADVLNEVARLYEKAGGAAFKPEAAAQSEAKNEFRYGVAYGPTPAPLVVLGFPTAPVESPDFPGLEVLRALLGTGQASSLNAHLAGRKSIVSTVTTELLDLPGAGCLTVQMEVEPKNIDRSEIAALTEFELLKKSEPGEDDLERAQAQLEREYWDRLETVSGRAQTIARYETQGDWKKMTQYISRVRAVKAADIPRLAEKYLRLEHCALLEYLPNGSEPRNLTAETAFNTLQGLLPSAVELAEADREKETIPAVNMPEPPTPFRASEIRFTMQKASILRGPEIYIREDHTLPLIHLGFFYLGGRLAETKEDAGITALMLRMMLQGSKEKPAALLARQLELYGAELIPVVDRDYFGIRLTVLSRNVEATFELLKEIFLNPAFDEEEFATLKAEQIADLRNEKSRATSNADQLLRSALFKDHPYGLNALGSETAANALTISSLRNWYAGIVHNRKPMIVIIGDTQGTSLAGFFVKSFSGSRFMDSKIPETFPKLPNSSVQLEADRGQGSSSVVAGFQAPPDGDEDSYAAVVLRSLLGDETGRLNEQVRDAQGLGYGIDVAYDRGARGGCMVIRVSTTPGNEEQVVKSLDGELKRVYEAPILYRDYRAAVNSAIAGFWVGQQDRLNQIDTLVRSVESGHGMEGVAEFPGHIQDVRQEDLVDIARRILNLDKSVTVRVHGKP